jgi:hypothetical protein
VNPTQVAGFTLIRAAARCVLVTGRSQYEEVSMGGSGRRKAITAAGAALAAGAVIATVASAPGNAATSLPNHAGTVVRYFGFDINNTTTDPGFVAVPGTGAATFAQGDQVIINDQLTTTHKHGSGYPILGHDSGVCTLTRIPEKYAEQTLGDCVVTAVVKGGSLTVQGVVRFTHQKPQAAVLAVTGGTGSFRGATGSVDVSFTTSHKILVFHLK